MATITTNFDKIWQSNDGEVFNANAFNFSQFNFDKVFSGTSVELEQLADGHSETSTIRDTFHTLTTQETITATKSQQTNNLDFFHSLVDQSVEQLEKLTIGWAFTSILLKEITDASKILPIILNPAVSGGNISVDYAVQNTSTAQNITEYEIDEGITGTLRFNGTNWNEHVQYLTIKALTQIFAKQQRTVVIKLSNVVGSGTFWPSVSFKAPATAGQYFFLFQNYWYAGTQFPIGTSAADQAQKLATAWNAANPACYQTNTGHYYRAVATVSGSTVSFALTPDNPLTSISGTFSFYNGNMQNLWMVANGGGNPYIYLKDSDRRPDNWNLTLDSQDTLIVTLDSHGPRPGTVSVFSYDTTTKRATKRGQVPTTAVSGLKDKLASIETRLKNRGF